MRVVGFGRLEAGASCVPGFGEVVWLSMIGSELAVGAKIREAPSYPSSPGCFGSKVTEAVV